MIQHLLQARFFRSIAMVVLAALLGGIPAQSGYAQVAAPMPPPGQMARVSGAFDPARMVGMRMDLKDPFSFYFVMNKGEQALAPDVKKAEYTKLIKYFLASLTTPNDDMWVNLSPVESNRIIPDNFAQTEMGRDLLAQDYLLKQFTSSLMYPEDQVGKEFWAKVYAKAFEQFGTTDIPVDTFNKVWIMADKANIYQKDDTVLLVDSHLKVMLQQDFMAIEQSKAQFGNIVNDLSDENDLPRKMAADIVREVIVPIIEKEINEGRNFAQVRQAYSSMILATWFKKTLKDSLLGQVYADKSKPAGIAVNDPQAREKIYQQYLEAYRVGVFNYIKDDINPVTQQPLPRKYFSGGIVIDPQVEQLVGESAAGNAEFARKPGRIEAVLTSLLTVAALTGALTLVAPQNVQAEGLTAAKTEQMNRLDSLPRAEVLRRLRKESTVSSGALRGKQIMRTSQSRNGPQKRPITVSKVGNLEKPLADGQKSVPRGSLPVVAAAPVPEVAVTPGPDPVAEPAPVVVIAPTPVAQSAPVVSVPASAPVIPNALTGSSASDVPTTTSSILGQWFAPLTVLLLAVVAGISAWGANLLRGKKDPAREAKGGVLEGKMDMRPVSGAINPFASSGNEASSPEEAKKKAEEDLEAYEQIRDDIIKVFQDVEALNNGTERYVSAWRGLWGEFETRVWRVSRGFRKPSPRYLLKLLLSVEKLRAEGFINRFNRVALEGRKQLQGVSGFSGKFNSLQKDLLTTVLVKDETAAIIQVRTVSEQMYELIQRLEGFLSVPEVAESLAAAQAEVDRINSTATLEGGFTGQILREAELRRDALRDRLAALQAEANSGEGSPDAAAVGGITMSDRYLRIDINVDGAGMPLPANLQDPAMVNIQGLSPVIREIGPVTPQNLPILTELIAMSR